MDLRGDLRGERVLRGVLRLDSERDLRLDGERDLRGDLRGDLSGERVLRGDLRLDGERNLRGERVLCVGDLRFLDLCRVRCLK